MERLTEDVAQALERNRAGMRLRSGWVLVLVLLFVAGSYLGSIVHSSEWVMDADESVHAVEALRLHDRLVRGDLGGFARDTYFPERWHPPVNPHVRWYPFVHAWCVQPFFLFLGANDFSARLPSILLLVGTGLCFFEIARRLAPASPAASGALAVLLLLTAPNVLTFSAQSLIATAGMFFAYLALLAYLWSLEGGHRLARSLPAGVALGIAALTKYDHGGFLALVLGLCELGRVRFSIPRFLRPSPSGDGPSSSVPLFAVAFLMIVAWFAHPDKLDALGDSVRHPFPPSLSRVVRDTGSTLFVEYASSVGVGLAALVAFVTLARRLREPGLRAVWLWLLFSTLFYVLRGRFYFRYNIVEGPGYLLLLGVALPGGWRRAAAWFARAGDASDLRRALAGWVLSSVVFGVGLFAWIAPETCFRWTSGTPLSVTEDFLDVFGYVGASLMALGGGGVVFCVARLVLHAGGTPRTAELLAGVAFVLPALPGAVTLYRELPERVDWELEGHPEIGELCAFVDANSPDKRSILLAGGWDQLTNNTLRWYLLTRAEGERNFDDVLVTGDMIGSIVFLPEPRVSYWKQALATAPIDELPTTIVRVIHGEDFLYHAWMGNENAVYGPVLEARGAYEPVARRAFETLGCEVEILSRKSEAAPLAALPQTPAYVQAKTDPSGWAFTDEALRHFDADRRDERRRR